MLRITSMGVWQESTTNATLEKCLKTKWKNDALF